MHTLWRCSQWLGMLVSDRSCRCAAAQDGTLIVTESGAQFPVRPDDWKFFNEKVPEVVRQYAEQGYKIVIFRSVFRRPLGAVRSATPP